MGKWFLGKGEVVGKLAGAERRKTVVKMYYIREESIFNFKKPEALLIEY